MPHRAPLIALLALTLAGSLPLPSAAADATGRAPTLKTMRYAFPVAETGFDPAQISDLYSRTVTAGIFEAPLRYDYLARPFRLKPATAEALPEVSADFRNFTVRIRPGIFFADDPAFAGKPRELTAYDYVYSYKRHYDPRWKSPNLYFLENARVLGLSELRQQAMAAKQPFPYDTEVEGIRALDRYTIQFKLAEPTPRFPEVVMGDGSAFGAVAREVVERYGDRIVEHPVGTGAFRLAEWRRSSRIVLERNPGFREELYSEQAPAGDAEAQAFAAALKGRRLPMVDRVEIAIIEETQPRWLSFLNGQSDVLERLPNEFANLAMPNNRLAPNLAKRGIAMTRAPAIDALLTFFNLDDPVVGGYTADKVALRRAIVLAYNGRDELRLIRKGQAVPAQGLIAPLSSGYDPALKTEMSDYDPARAKALLDLYGYTDRDGDGWRDLPDGSPLTLEIATQPDQLSRQLAELWQKSMKAVNLRVAFKAAKWPENLKASNAGKLMMWGVAWGAESPDGDTFLALGYGPNTGQSNRARFNLPAYNALYVQQSRMPDGPERDRVMAAANKLAVAYAPYKISGHRIVTDLMQPGVVGYRRNTFVREFWKYVDMAAPKKAAP